MTRGTYRNFQRTSETSIEQMQTETYRRRLTELICDELHVDDVLIEDLKIFISKEDENA